MGGWATVITRVLKSGRGRQKRSQQDVGREMDP